MHAVFLTGTLKIQGNWNRLCAPRFDYAGPALVSVKVAKHELSFPPTIDFEQAKGFGIYLIKAMLNGNGDEILHLTVTNLRAFFRDNAAVKREAPETLTNKFPLPI